MNIFDFFGRKVEDAQLNTGSALLLPKTENRHFDRYKVIPALYETDHLALEWYPYIMRRSKPEHYSLTLNTDEYGFRKCDIQGRLIGFEDVLKHAGPVGLFSGNSTAFGIGVTSDSKTAPSFLNNGSAKALWYNMAHRASNLTQERINLDLYAPENAEYIVFLSGANNLIAILLDESRGRFCTPFVGEPKFLTLNPPANKTFPKIEERYRLMLEAMNRDFMLIGQKVKSNKLKCLFMLQPLAAWCARSFSKEEIELIEIWDAHPSFLHSVHSPKSLNPWRESFVESVRELCQKNDLDFIDMNTCEKFLSGKWVFADRVHLADEGHKIIAEVIMNWLNNESINV